VSLWWREQLSVSLTPGRVSVRRRARGPGRRALEGAEAAVIPAAEAAPGWRAALQTFEGLVEASGWRNADLDVVLSNQFVHYLALPWVDNLSGGDVGTYARHQLQAVYGVDAANWALCIGRAAAGLTRIAAATEAALIDELRALSARHRLHLQGVQPLLAAECAALPAADVSSGWLALVEAGRMSVSRLEGGHCMSIRSAAFDGDADRQLLTLLEQDALCAGAGTAAAKLYLRASTALDSSLLRDHGWQVLPGAMQALQ
jgi:hypothetical protein